MRRWDVSDLVTNTVSDTKISGLIKKIDCDVKYSDIEKKILDHNHDKYITTQEFNKLTSDNFDARLKQAN